MLGFHFVSSPFLSLSRFRQKASLQTWYVLQSVWKLPSLAPTIFPPLLAEFPLPNFHLRQSVFLSSPVFLAIFLLITTFLPHNNRIRGGNIKKKSARASLFKHVASDFFGKKIKIEMLFLSRSFLANSLERKLQSCLVVREQNSHPSRSFHPNSTTTFCFAFFLASSGLCLLRSAS